MAMGRKDEHARSLRLGDGLLVVAFEDGLDLELLGREYLLHFGGASYLVVGVALAIADDDGNRNRTR